MNTPATARITAEAATITTRVAPLEPLSSSVNLAMDSFMMDRI